MTCRTSAALVAGAIAAGAACELRPRPAQAPDDAAPVATGDAAPPLDAAPRPRRDEPLAAAPGAPRLVLLVVVDQLPDWALDLHLPLLAEDGLLRRALGNGRRARAELPYAATLTAPGHGTVSTGTTPAEHGIYTNSLWSGARRSLVSIVDDGEHPVAGRGDVFASPAVLRRPTIADALKASTGGKARVVSLSLKERAAVALGGKRPDLALWYDKKVRGFTTSSYYGAVPAWLTGHQAAFPLEPLLAPWTVDDGDRLAARLGPDDAAGETTLEGFGRTFPHDPSRTRDPWGFVRATPAMAEYLVDLAGAAAEAAELGGDDVPDLLALSMSSVDYAGHLYGAASWEYADTLRRADRALGRLVDRLAARGPIAVVITADHGVAPLAESGRARAFADGKPSGRVEPELLTTMLDTRFDETRGPGDWIAHIAEPYVYLGADGLEARAEVVPQLVTWLGQQAGVAYAVDVATARTWTADPDPTRRLIAASIPADPRAVRGDIYILPLPSWIFDPEEPPGTGANHGTPYPYDRLIPLIIAGTGVTTAGAATLETVDARRIAPTVAALLGVPAGKRPGGQEPVDGVSR
jgi:predicted AlkP superfamily pyrophosphatase or phosphodiesterase